MDKLGLFVLISVLNVLHSVSAAHSKAETARDTNPTSGDVSFEDINQILKRLDDSESLTKQLIDRVEHLEDRDKVQQEEIRSLKAALDRRSETEASRESHTRPSGHLDTPNSGSQHRFQYSQARSQSLRNLRDTPRHQHQDRRMKYVEDNVDASMPIPNGHLSQVQYIAQPRRIRRQGTFNTPHVAFSATLTSHQTHIGQHQAIIFDKVVTNFGNAYHNHLGSFIAPFDGTYVFAASLLAMHNTYGNFILAKNGTTVTYLYHGMPQAGFAVCSQTFILYLQQGDDVTIQNNDPEKSVYGNVHSTFSGFLLFEDESNPEIVG